MTVSHQTIFWSIVAALVAIQLARRGVTYIKTVIWSSKLQTVGESFDSFDDYIHHIDNENKRLLRTVIDADIRQNGDPLYEEWRSLVLSSSLDSRKQLEQYQSFIYTSEAATRIKDVVHRTTDLDADKKSPMPFLWRRLEGYLLAVAFYHFVERVETQAEFQAIFFQILDNNSFQHTSKYRSLLGASYLRVQKTNDMGKGIGRPAVIRFEFARKGIGLLSLMEARFLNEIFLYSDVAIMTNAEPTAFTRRIAKVLRIKVLGRKNLQAMTIPTW